MEMTPYHWAMLVITVGGIVGTWVFGSFKLGRAVEQMKAGFKEHIDGKLAVMAERFTEENRQQDHNFGEVNAAIRQKVSDVEKEMHTIEIWSRDNFVLKSEFVKATDSIRSDIKAMAADIKNDLRDITAKISKQ